MAWLSHGKYVCSRFPFKVIQQHPLTAVIFMGSLMTLVFGVLNIIAAGSHRAGGLAFTYAAMKRFG